MRAVLWSAIKGVLDVASMPFGRRRGHVPWNVADVVNSLTAQRGFTYFERARWIDVEHLDVPGALAGVTRRDG
jgi:hypothetical protein